jgi:CubicO group peptidase (beta-lactamase class C family)
MPSSNGICTARSLARLYAAVIGPVDGAGKRLLRAETVRHASAIEASGPDRVILIPTAFGLGFMLPPSLAASARPGSFGHPGAGGSLGYADPSAGIALGYVMNRMDMGLTGDPRSHTLLDAVYASIEG